MKINLPIEVLIIGIIFFLFVFWMIWFNITRAIAKKKYKPHNDKSRKGEEIRRESIRIREPEPSSADESISGPSEPSEPSVLQTPDVISTGKDSKRFRGIFKRRRK